MMSTFDQNIERYWTAMGIAAEYKHGGGSPVSIMGTSRPVEVALRIVEHAQSAAAGTR